MDCNRCVENLTAYLDGELSPEAFTQVQLHLKACSSCSEEFRSFQRASDFVASHVKELNLPPGSWNRVRDRIEDTKSPAFWNLPFLIRWRPAVAALACIAVFAFGYLWYQQVQRQSLDAYIARYEKARQADLSFRRVLARDDFRLVSGTIAIDNPFIEARAGLDINLFRSEDR